LANQFYDRTAHLDHVGCNWKPIEASTHHPLLQSLDDPIKKIQKERHFSSFFWIKSNAHGKHFEQNRSDVSAWV